MMSPKVSICVLTYNHRSYIKRCLESVIDQADETSTEILVGDDCSDDGTSEIVAAFAAAHPQLVQHMRRDPRIGATANSLALLRQARGKMIAHMDGDDYWLPGKLIRQVEYLDVNPDCAAVYTNALTISESGETIGLFNNVGNARLDLAALLRRGNFLNTSSILVRGELKQSVLEIDEPFIDYRAHLRYARHGYLAHLEQPLTAYRVASRGSMVTHTNDAVRAQYWQAVLDVPRELVSDRDFALGIADFLSRVFARTITARRFSLLREWLPRVCAASPYGMPRTCWLAAVALVRRLTLTAVYGLRRRFGRGARILYIR